MAIEGDVVQRLSLAQRNPKHMDALGGVYYICFVDHVELVGEDQYQKHDHEFLQTYASNPWIMMMMVNEDRCQRLRFFFPG
ncbi:unnamed protein product [Camellia sinensis]